MKKLALLFMTLVSGYITAQDTIVYKRLISFSPQYLFNYGVKIDFERKIANNNWLVISPQIYLAEKKASSENESIEENDFNTLLGGGLTISMKNFVDKGNKLGAYLGYGVMYNYYYVNYYKAAENDDTEEVDAGINKIGLDVTLGYQFIAFEFATFDIYTGMAVRHSTMDNNDKKFTNYPFGFNFSGNILLLGLRIGILY